MLPHFFDCPQEAATPKAQHGTCKAIESAKDESQDANTVSAVGVCQVGDDKIFWFRAAMDDPIK